MGCIYIIKPDPTARPNRVKVGYGERVESRLKECRRWCPDAVVISSWDGMSLDHEAIVLSGVAEQHGCEMVGREVFDVADIAAIVEYCGKLLPMLPKHISRQPKKRKRDEKCRLTPMKDSKTGRINRWRKVDRRLEGGAKYFPRHRGETVEAGERRAWNEWKQIEQDLLRKDQTQ